MVPPLGGASPDHVYFVHPLTDISVDISVDISTDTRPMYRSTYRTSVSRYVAKPRCYALYYM